MTLTLKKRLKNAGILTAVFIVAVIIFSYVTNKGNDNMTADMGAATLPTTIPGRYDSTFSI